MRHDKFPAVIYLHSGQWLIASHSKLTIHLCCLNNQQQSLSHYEISKPIEIVQLKSGCGAYSTYFRMLPYYHATSSDTSQPIISEVVKTETLLKDIWNFTLVPDREVSAKIDISNLNLADIEQMSVSKLQEKLQAVKYNSLVFSQEN